MKRIFFLYAFLLVHVCISVPVLSAQDCELNFSWTNTGSNMTIMIRQDALQNEILQNGFNKVTLQKMQNLNYELLKLDKAQLEQGEEKKRKSNTSKQQNKPNSLNQLKFKKQFYNQIEILNRQSLPLQQNYKKKVRAYFSDIKQ